ncbi:MAG: PAS domain-containing protein, partial [Candidatus Limnocylindrales bacterium]
EQLASKLRPIYPEIAVSERLISGEPRAVYVYRDGSLRPEDRERWWTEPGTPSVSIDLKSGHIESANDGWARVVDAGHDTVVGRPYSDFLMPEAAQLSRTMLAILRETGEARSSVVVRRDDGRHRTYDFRATLTDDLATVWFRPR